MTLSKKQRLEIIRGDARFMARHCGGSFDSWLDILKIRDLTGGNDALYACVYEKNPGKALRKKSK